MKTLMISWMAVAMCVLVGTVWAQVSNTVPDPDSVVLARNFFCSTKQVLSGNVALLVGFLIAAGGMWQLIQGNAKGGIVMIIAGALLTALPSLVLSTFQGINGALGGLKQGTAPLDIPKC